jgi:hypothetical protein
VTEIKNIPPFLEEKKQKQNKKIVKQRKT